MVASLEEQDWTKSYLQKSTESGHRVQPTEKHTFPTVSFWPGPGVPNRQLTGWPPRTAGLGQADRNRECRRSTHQRRSEFSIHSVKPIFDTSARWPLAKLLTRLAARAAEFNL